MGRRKVDVSMGDEKVGKGSTVISTQGVGSCVAVCLFSKDKEIGGVAHVMLPGKDSNGSDRRADILLEKLIDEMKEKGATPSGIRAKIFGGASMFGDSTIEVGQKNLTSVKSILEDENIELVAKDTGGNSGRAVWLNCRSGDVTVRRTGSETEIY